MTFTDDDLKRFKERFGGSMSDPFKVEALITRLEAAEQALYGAKRALGDRYLPFTDLYEAWRKEAGK